MASSSPLIRMVGLAGGLALGLDAVAAPVLAQGWGAPPPAPPATAPVPATAAGTGKVQTISQRAVPLDLTVERRGDSLDLVIAGVGAAPQLQQSVMGDAWLGRLFLASPSRLRRGPQTLSLPEAGIQSISISGGGNQFDLQVRPVAGYPLGRPVVSADGSNLILSFAATPQASQQSYSRDLSLPGRVPGPDMAPPLQPRAVAPPVGDMAVGSIVVANSGFVNLSGPPITMTLQNASAAAVLMSLSRLGGYGFVYVNDDQSANPAAAAAAPTPAATTAPRISIAFRGENYARAVNAVLLAAGLQGKVEGRTLLAGPNVLNKGFGAKLSKVIRLNQVGANSAADYLANLGAQVSKTNTITTAVTQGVSQNQAVATSPASATTQSSTTTRVEAYGASTGPLLGLQATTDSRLSTITLVGSPAVVAVAETYLRQLDLRQRQVALSVKILDVSLDNDRSVDNSFAFRYGNNFIVNDSGNLVGAFGALLPPDSGAFSRAYPETVSFDITRNEDTGAIKVTGEGPNGNNILGGAMLGGTVPGAQGSVFKDATKRNPGLAYPKDNFYNFLKSVITSGSTKVLASPTLILSENSEELRQGDDTLAVNFQASVQAGQGGGSGSGSGSSGSDSSSKATIGRTKANEAFVTVGEQQITSFQVQAGQNGAPNSCQPVLGISGLTFGARVSKIDDNGFVTFSMSPSISATVGSTVIPGCGPIKTLAIRRLDTGSARVRDGQTLILTGVISDRDTEVVQKWPIVGDIPFIGQFFRNSSNNRAKRELVIMVTPRIIDDTEGGTWGYGYQPSSRDARRFLGTSTGQSPY